jgi:hypothetical protein
MKSDTIVDMAMVFFYMAMAVRQGICLWPLASDPAQSKVPAEVSQNAGHHDRQRDVSRETCGRHSPGVRKPLASQG